MPELIAALDVLLLPSWEEPFGRAMIEAMALEVPVLATNVGGPAEIIAGRPRGLPAAAAPARAWAQAIGAAGREPRRAGGDGRAGRMRVEQAFTVPEHVRAMLACYERAMQARGERTRSRRRR